MKTLCAFALAATMMIAVPSARAANATGTWQGAFDYHGLNVPLTFHLTVSGNTVNGTVEGLSSAPAEIHDGKVDGEKISFSANAHHLGQDYKLVFDGRISNTSEISFTMASDDGGWSTPLVAHRSAEAAQPDATPASTATAAPSTSAAAASPSTVSHSPDPPDVSGAWKGSFDFEGSPIPVIFHLKADGTAVSGNVAGMVQGATDTQVEIHDGKIDGDTLTFWLNTSYQGETYKIVYSGTVVEGKIHFTFGTDDGSWSSELTATR